jgi:hypothetical protein
MTKTKTNSPVIVADGAVAAAAIKIVNQCKPMMTMPKSKSQRPQL